MRACALSRLVFARFVHLFRPSQTALEVELGFTVLAKDPSQETVLGVTADDQRGFWLCHACELSNRLRRPFEHVGERAAQADHKAKLGISKLRQAGDISLDDVDLVAQSCALDVGRCPFQHLG